MFPASARSGHHRAPSLEPPSPEEQIASALGPWKQYESIPQFRSTWHASNDLTTSDQLLTTERLPVLFDDSDRLFQRVHGNVAFVLGHNERRRDANRARPAAQKQDAAFERQLHNAITLAGAVLASLLVFHNLDADHQATSADVSDDLVLLRPVGHAFQHVGADFLRIL